MNEINEKINIIIVEDEEDQFYKAYKQIISNDQSICSIGEDYIEIEKVSASNEIEKCNNTFSSQNESPETSKIYKSSKSLCNVSESNNAHSDLSNISKKCKSCKCLQNFKLL